MTQRGPFHLWAFKKVFGAALKSKSANGAFYGLMGIAMKTRYNYIEAMSTQPTRPGPKPELDDDTKAVLTERLKTRERIGKMRALPMKCSGAFCKNPSLDCDLHSTCGRGPQTGLPFLRSE
jgi:hypothetical protein